MFRVEQKDALGSSFSNWDTFEEANLEYERQLLRSVRAPNQPPIIILSMVLREFKDR